MDSKIREKLQEQLGDYILNTLRYVGTVIEFCDGETEWMLLREAELDKMRNIKDLKNSKRQELEKELGEVLKNTLEGLEKLQHFLDAVEKLAVTSLFVFMGESFMPKGVSSVPIRSVISAARLASPLIVHFKRDAEVFFLPILNNVEVLTFQLVKYIRITQQICWRMQKGSRSISWNDVHEWKHGKLLEFNLIVSEENLQKLCDNLTQLIAIRMDESFRMTFLFKEKAQDFIQIFSERHPRMVDFLSGLDAAAVQLDKMKLGSNISTVVGSSVGVAGGVLSIVGIALAPVTAGVSLILTATGIGLGVTSGVNRLVTGITEMAVNSHRGKTANNIFNSFMEDVQKILECIDDAGRIKAPEEALHGVSTVLSAGKLVICAGAVAKRINDVVNAGRNVPKLAELPEIGQVAKGTSLALSKSASVGLIGLNAFFIALDVFFICKDGVSLAKGSKNEMAELFRSRSVLWRSEVQAWEKIHHRLVEGIPGFNRKLRILEEPLI